MSAESNLVSDIFRAIDNGLFLVARKMSENNGVLNVMKARLSFEKWLQIELMHCILENILTEKELSCHCEISIDKKTSKRAETIDLAIKWRGNKFIAIELKIIPTNYQSEEFETKVKAVTDGINGMINDLRKCETDGHPYRVAIGFVFPFPRIENHINLNGFKRQETKLKETGFLRTLNIDNFQNFDARFYLLSNVNVGNNKEMVIG